MGLIVSVEACKRNSIDLGIGIDLLYYFHISTENIPRGEISSAS